MNASGGSRGRDWVPRVRGRSGHGLALLRASPVRHVHEVAPAVFEPSHSDWCVGSELKYNLWASNGGRGAGRSREGALDTPRRLNGPVSKKNIFFHAKAVSGLLFRDFTLHSGLRRCDRCTRTDRTRETMHAFLLQGRESCA